MFNITHYSLFFMKEAYFRINYFIISFIIISIYSLFFFNEYILQILYPIRLLNIDLNNSILHDWILRHLYSNVLDHYNTFSTINNNLVYDCYPIFEINIINNNILYIYIYIYIIILSLLPILLYHIYLFVLPGLYNYELENIRKLLFLFIIIYIIYCKYIHIIFIVIIMSITYNNYYELYEYEFDIEFNFVEYISDNIKLMLLFYINIIVLLFSIYSTNIYKYIYITTNLFMIKSIIICIIYIALLYTCDFIIFIHKQYLKKN